MHTHTDRQRQYVAYSRIHITCKLLNWYWIWYYGCARTSRRDINIGWHNNGAHLFGSACLVICAHLEDRHLPVISALRGGCLLFYYNKDILRQWEYCANLQMSGIIEILTACVPYIYINILEAVFWCVPGKNFNKSICMTRQLFLSSERKNVPCICLIINYYVSSFVHFCNQGLYGNANFIISI